MSQEEFVIEATNLCFQVGKRYLLKDINVQIKAGEHWLIYGMNGCGKTTLLSILSGFQQQTSGSLKVFGETLTNDNVLNTRKRIGWISSSFFDTRYHHEIVRDIVLSGCFGTYGIDWEITSEQHLRAMALLKELDLEDKAYQSYDRLSKGQRQNVLIARAFMNTPDILLLDEPYSGLDVLAKARFMDLLEKLMERKDLTVLFVSHEVNDVHDMFPNTLILRNGRVFATGDTQDLFQDDKLSSFFQQKVAVKDVIEHRINPLGDTHNIDMELFK